MKITNRQLRRIICESMIEEPFDITKNTHGVGESIGYDYTVTERRPSLFQGIGGQPMERVAFTYRISPGDDTIVYSDFPAVPKGMPLKDFFEAGLNRGFPDMYPPIPSGNVATGTAKGMPRVDGWEKMLPEGRVRITKGQLRRIIKEAVYDQMSYDLGLSTKDGLRTPLAKLLASVAKSEPAGWEPRTREEKDMMLDLKEKGLVNYGLDPRGGYRGHITDLGRKGIQRI